MDTNFIYPSFTKTVQPYFEDLWKTTNEYGWIDVLYEGQVVLQIWNVPNDTTTKNVILSFYPYSYGYGLVNRFKTCQYYADFAAFDSEEDNYMQAAYGTDIVKALQVASYILAYVYEIPTNYSLQIDPSAPAAKW